MINFDFTWIITAISLTASYLNVKKMVFCFYLWSISTVLCSIIDFNNKQYGRVFLDLFMLLVDVYGIISWSKKNNSKKSRIQEETK